MGERNPNVQEEQIQVPQFPVRRHHGRRNWRTVANQDFRKGIEEPLTQRKRSLNKASLFRTIYMAYNETYKGADQMEENPYDAIARRVQAAGEKARKDKGIKSDEEIKADFFEEATALFNEFISGDITLADGRTLHIPEI